MCIKMESGCWSQRGQQGVVSYLFYGRTKKEEGFWLIITEGQGCPPGQINRRDRTTKLTLYYSQLKSQPKIITFISFLPKHISGTSMILERNLDRKPLIPINKNTNVCNVQLKQNAAIFHNKRPHTFQWLSKKTYANRNSCHSPSVDKMATPLRIF